MLRKLTVVVALAFLTVLLPLTPPAEAVQVCVNNAPILGNYCTADYSLDVCDYDATICTPGTPPPPCPDLHPQVCPSYADAGCTALGGWAHASYGSWQVEASRAEAYSYGAGPGAAHADAAKLTAWWLPAFADVVHARCDVYADWWYGYREARGEASTADVDLFVGLVTAKVAETRVSLDNYGNSVVYTNVDDVRVAGYPMGPIVGTNVVVAAIPNVMMLRANVVDTPSPTYGCMLSAAALELITYDQWTNVQDRVRISHVAVRVC